MTVCNSSSHTPITEKRDGNITAGTECTETEPAKIWQKKKKKKRRKWELPSGKWGHAVHVHIQSEQGGLVTAIFGPASVAGNYPECRHSKVSRPTAVKKLSDASLPKERPRSAAGEAEAVGHQQPQQTGPSGRRPQRSAHQLRAGGGTWSFVRFAGPEHIQEGGE